MAAPLLAVAWRVEQAVNQQLPRARRFVGEERLDLGGRRWKAGQIVVSAADQLARRGGRVRGEILRGELRDDEGVNGIGEGRLAIADCGDGGPPHRLEGPVRAVLRGDLKFLPDGSDGRFARRHRRTELHPLGQVGDLPDGEPLLGRHLEVCVLIADGDDEPTLGRVAGDDDRPAFSTRANGPGRVESEMALLLLRAVAGVTVLGEQRADLALEELEAGGGGFGGLAWEGGAEENCKAETRRDCS